MGSRTLHKKFKGASSTGIVSAATRLRSAFCDRLMHLGVTVFLEDRGRCLDFSSTPLVKGCLSAASARSMITVGIKGSGTGHYRDVNCTAHQRSCDMLRDPLILLEAFPNRHPRVILGRPTQQSTLRLNDFFYVPVSYRM